MAEKVKLATWPLASFRRVSKHFLDLQSAVLVEAQQRANVEGVGVSQRHVDWAMVVSLRSYANRIEKDLQAGGL